MLIERGESPMQQLPIKRTEVNKLSREVCGVPLSFGPPRVCSQSSNAGDPVTPYSLIFFSSLLCIGLRSLSSITSCLLRSFFFFFDHLRKLYLRKATPGSIVFRSWQLLLPSLFIFFANFLKWFLKGLSLQVNLEKLRKLITL